MARLAPALALSTLFLLAAVPSAAAPVARSAELRLTAYVPATGGYAFDFSVATTVSVDATAGSVWIPGGIFGGGSIALPVSSNTSVSSMSVQNLDLLGGTFRPGGATAVAPNDLCPAGGPPFGAGDACVFGGALGGAVGLTGTVHVNIIPGVVVIPLDLALHVGVGGSTNVPFEIHAAPWTAGRAVAATPLGIIETNETHLMRAGHGASVAGTLDAAASRFSLVTPVHVEVLGNIVAPSLVRPWRLQIAFTDGLGIPAFIVDAIDRDEDGVVNFDDNCPDDPNPDQADADSDGKGDACEPQCSNGLDDDGDGDVDAADSACLVPTFDDESPPCANGLDDDGDGLADFPDDPGCANVAWPLEDPACNDGLDNDGDTATDFPADAGCAAAWAISEEPECSDGLDNDGDGAIDHPADPGCENAAGPNEAPACNDGKNNDGAQDALIDFDGGAAAGLPPEQQTAPDPQCEGHGWGATEIQERGCGLGGEAALALLAIAALRRRRRPR